MRASVCGVGRLRLHGERIGGAIAPSLGLFAAPPWLVVRLAAACGWLFVCCYETKPGGYCLQPLCDTVVQSVWHGTHPWSSEVIVGDAMKIREIASVCLTRAGALSWASLRVRGWEVCRPASGFQCGPRADRNKAAARTFATKIDSPPRHSEFCQTSPAFLVNLSRISISEVVVGDEMRSRLTTQIDKLCSPARVGDREDASD